MSTSSKKGRSYIPDKHKNYWAELPKRLGSRKAIEMLRRAKNYER